MRIATILALTVISAIPLLAQDAQSLPAPPDVVAVPFYLDSSASQMKKLSAESFNNKNPTPGVFTMKQSIEVKGAASAFRIPIQDKIVFVYDAVTTPRLYPFVVNDDKRKFEYGKVSVRGSTPIDGLPISISRYKEKAFQFSSDQPLNPGEYAIVFGDHIYTFGVDNKK